MALILIRYFNGMNSVPCSNVIYLHTFTKVITIRHSYSCFAKEFDAMLNSDKCTDTIKYIVAQATDIRNRLKGALPQILFLCNQETDKNKASPAETARKPIIEDIYKELASIRYFVLTKAGVPQ